MAESTESKKKNKNKNKNKKALRNTAINPAIENIIAIDPGERYLCALVSNYEKSNPVLLRSPFYKNNELFFSVVHNLQNGKYLEEKDNIRNLVSTCSNIILKLCSEWNISKVAMGDRSISNIETTAQRNPYLNTSSFIMFFTKWLIEDLHMNCALKGISFGCVSEFKTSSNRNALQKMGLKKNNNVPRDIKAAINIGVKNFGSPFFEEVKKYRLWEGPCFYTIPYRPACMIKQSKLKFFTGTLIDNSNTKMIEDFKKTETFKKIPSTRPYISLNEVKRISKLENILYDLSSSEKTTGFTDNELQMLILEQLNCCDKILLPQKEKKIFEKKNEFNMVLTSLWNLYFKLTILHKVLDNIELQGMICPVTKTTRENRLFHKVLSCRFLKLDINKELEDILSLIFCNTTKAIALLENRSCCYKALLEVEELTSKQFISLKEKVEISF